MPLKTLKENIIEEIRMGNQQALEDVYRFTFPIVRKHIGKNSGTEEDAKDIFHDGMHILLHKIYQHKIDSNTDPIPYLLGICKNLWLKRLSKIQPMEDIHTDSISGQLANPTEEGYDPETIQLVHQYLNQTGNKCKSILMAFYFQNLTMKEIADKFGYRTEASAKNRKYSCLQTLIQLSKEQLLKYL